MRVLLRGLFGRWVSLNEIFSVLKLVIKLLQNLKFAKSLKLLSSVNAFKSPLFQVGKQLHLMSFDFNLKLLQLRFVVIFEKDPESEVLFLLIGQGWESMIRGKIDLVIWVSSALGVRYQLNWHKPRFCGARVIMRAKRWVDVCTACERLHKLIVDHVLNKLRGTEHFHILVEA